MNNTELEIQKKILELAKEINVPDNLLPTFGYTEDFARPHIEVNNQNLHWVIVERGVERDRKTTQNEDELLYWVFRNITGIMASACELRNRRENEDSRRQRFKHQLMLLEKLNPRWKEVREEEIFKILEAAPFRD